MIISYCSRKLCEPDNLMTPLEEQILSILKRAREASRSLALASTAVKNSALLSLTKALRANASKILEANRRDIEGAKSSEELAHFSNG